MTEDILEELEALGLTKTESLVYLMLVKKGSSTAYRISKDAQLYKANTYQAIDSLVKKNLVTRLEVNGKPKIKAVSPDEFLNNIERQKEKFQAILPRIKRSFEEDYEDVSVFTGIEAFFNVFYKLLDQNQPIYVYDIPSYVPDLVRNFIDKFHKERIRKKIHMYHIYDYDAKDRIKYLENMRYTFAKQGKKDRLSVVSSFACGNTCLIINWQKGIKFVKIVDKDIADTFRHQFNVLWNYK